MTNIEALSLDEKRELLAKLLQEEAKAIKTVHPLSYNQQALWLIYQEAPHSPAYNFTLSLRILSEVNVPVLKKCFQTLVTRHPSLRSTIELIDNAPRQVIHGHQEIDFEHIQVYGRSEEEVEKYISDTYRKPFDLVHGPITRVHLFSMSDTHHVLLVNMHHIIYDGWSHWLLMSELLKLYPAYRSDQKIQLPKLDYTYLDFVDWQMRLISSPKGEEMWQYWKTQLAGELPILNLPTDYPHPRIQLYVGDSIIFGLSTEDCQKLKKTAAKAGSTLYMILLAAYQVLLYRYTLQEDILVGSPVTGRSQSEFADIIGYFVNVITLRAKLEKDMTFMEFLYQVRSTCLEALTHQDFPFPELVKRLKPKRNASRSPIVQALFTLQKAQKAAELSELLGSADGSNTKVEAGGLTFAPYKLTQPEGQFDLSLAAMETKNGLGAVFFYRTDIFKKETISALTEHFQTLLYGIINNPNQSISTLPLLNESEKQMLLTQWVGANSPFPETQRFSELFEKQVTLDPDNIAVFLDQSTMTYKDLNERANKLAHYLVRQGVRAESIVGICLSRSFEMLIAIVAINKAGGAFLPLNPFFPPERLHYMVSHANTALILTEPQYVPLFNQSGSCMCLDLQNFDYGTYPSENPVYSSVPNQLAYVIYTSGSTGVPKGVMVETIGMVNHLYAKIRELDLKAKDRVGQNAPLTFDIAIWQCLAPLLTGAGVVLIPEEIADNPNKLLDLTVEARLSILEVVPSVLTVMIKEINYRKKFPGFKKLRYLVCTGETLPSKLAKEWLTLYPHIPIVNAYGPTECSDDVTHYFITQLLDAETNTIPIGKPIQNTQLYVLNDTLELMPIGVLGEIYVGGVGIGRGYLNDSEKTNRAFIKNPFSSDSSDRLFKTGDLGRWLRNGNLEFLGRIDHQVKMRGFRIELQDIEASLTQHPFIKEALVLLHNQSVADSHLVAFIIGQVKSQIDYSEVKTFLKSKLPDYMIPTYFIPCPSFPLNSNGKIDRNALKTLAQQELKQNRKKIVAPKTDEEKKISAIWQELLADIDNISIHDNFFDLGGHSLLATQAITRIQNTFQVDIPFNKFFESPTVADLSKYVLTARHQDKTLGKIEIESADRTQLIPLSFAQERLWFLDHLNPENPFYNTPIALNFKGSLNKEALQKSLAAIVERHEILRTHFPLVEGKPIQVLKPHSDVVTKLSITDFSVYPERKRKDLLNKLISEQEKFKFNLKTGPLFHYQLIILQNESFILLINLHHIITDGWSAGIFIKEVSALYSSFLHHTSSNLPALLVQYADFSVWQRTWFKGDILETQRHYWKEKLQGAPQVLEIPSDYLRPAINTYQGSHESFRLTSKLTQKINELCRDLQVTPFMLYLTAYAILLGKYSHQDDIIIGSPIANRNQAQIEPLLGFFVNTLALRINMEGNPTFASLLSQIKQTTLDAYSHQDFPFENLIELLRIERDMTRNPLVQMSLAFQNAPKPNFNLENITIDLLEFETKTVRFDLEFHLWEEDGQLTGKLYYYKDLFKKATVKRFLNYFQTLLNAIVAAPTMPISDYNLLSKADVKNLLVKWNQTEQTFSSECVHELFEHQVKLTPEAIALKYGHASLTYRVLNQRANQLAHYLISITSAKTENFIGIYLNRSIEMVIAILGVLKAGMAYVPFDPKYPKNRLDYMIADSKIKYLITQNQYRDSFSDLVPCIYVDDDAEKIALLPEKNLAIRLPQEALAYVIYTSGSTGQPKGTLLTHQGLVNYLTWAKAYYKSKDGNGAPVQISISFDATITCLYLPLLSGKAVDLLSPENELSELSYALAQNRQYSLVKLTPAHLRVLQQQADQPAYSDSSANVFVIGGEALTASHIEFWQKNAPSIRLVNEYGPTESVVGCCIYEIENQTYPYHIPIGRPIANTKLYVLDDALNLSPIGIPGELHISGVGLAKGYLNNPELTNAKFILNPFDKNPESRFYKTGDLVRYLPDGNLEFLGRIDDQLKLNGYRIELEEIESVIRNYPQARDTAVSVLKGKNAKQQLVSYVVPDFSNDTVVTAPDDTTIVKQWLAVFQSSYEQSTTASDLKFNLAGWTSSYSGKAISNDAMAEWVEETVTTIHTYAPRNVLEIGCGTGLLLSRIAPTCEEYWATDFSINVIAAIEKLKTQDVSLSSVRLFNQPAHEFIHIPENYFDTIVINSVIQYFPSIDYLLIVLKKAITTLKPGGRIICGDIRHLGLLPAFYASKALYKSEYPGFTAIQLEQKIAQSFWSEEELVINPRFFEGLTNLHPSISGAEILLKRGVHDNEMVKYRYDAVIHVQSQADIRDRIEWQNWDSRNSLQTVKAILKACLKEPEKITGFKSIPNLRLKLDLGLVKWLKKVPGMDLVSSYKTSSEKYTEDGIDPEIFWKLGEELSLCVRLFLNTSKDNGSYDVVFWNPKLNISPVFSTHHNENLPWEQYANNLVQNKRFHSFVSDLRHFLQDWLPHYMVPSTFILIPHIPLTSSGKIAYRTLEMLTINREENSTGKYMPPQSENEKKLAQIWSEILEIEKIGINDNFFELGGDSILSIQIISRANQLGLGLNLKQFFQNQTIASLASVATNSNSSLNAQQSFVSGNVPLTPIQKWFFEQNLANPNHYNQSILLKVSSELTPQIAIQILNALISHHDVLRLSFQWTGNEVIATHLEKLQEATLTHVDLTGLSETAQEETIQKVTRTLQSSLNLEKGLLIKWALFERGATQSSYLLWVMHHLVVDGYSWRILLEDFCRAFTQLCQNQAIALPLKTHSFKIWSKQLQQYGKNETLLSELTMWSTITNSEIFPVDFPENLTQNKVSDLNILTFSLSKTHTSALLSQAPKAHKTQINDLLMTALVLSLSEWSPNHRFLIELEGHGREPLFEHIDISRTVGWFTNSFPVVFERVSKKEDMGTLLVSIKEKLRHIPNHGIGFGVLRDLCPEGTNLKKLETPPLRFNYLGRFQNELHPPITGFSLDSHPFDNDTNNQRSHILEINAGIKEEHLDIHLGFNKTHYNSKTIQTFGSLYLQALEKVIAYCTQRDFTGYTPSDFPDTKLSLDDIRHIQAEIFANNPPLDVIEAIYSLSPSQKGMLIGSLSDQGSQLFIEQAILHIVGCIDKEALSFAWKSVCDRHDILRTVFLWKALNVPLQAVLKQISSHIHFEDLRDIPSSQRKHLINTFIEQDYQTPFDLNQAPLMRLSLFRVEESQYVLIFTHHHILMDGWCMSIILKDLINALKNIHQEVDTYEKAPPYKTYIRWLERQHTSQAETYWKTALKGFQSSTPLGKILAVKENTPFTREQEIGKIVLDCETTHQIREILKERHLTLNTLVQGIWALLLSRYSGNSDVVFGVTVSGRPADLNGIESMLGLFINTVPMRVQISGDSFWNWLKTIQSIRQQTTAYEYCSSGQIHQWSEIISTEPLYESILVFENYPMDMAENQPFKSLGWTLTQADYKGAKTHYPLVILINPGSNLEFHLIYHKSRFEKVAIDHLTQHLTQLFLYLATPQNHEVSVLTVPDFIKRIPENQIIQVRPWQTDLEPDLYVPPKDSLEWQLCQLWESVLGIKPISVRANFFALGGHSILAAELAAIIEQRWSKAIPLATLIQNPTIETLADVLRQNIIQFSSLVPLQKEGKKSPLFCIHGVGGNVLNFFPLAQDFSDRPVYGLQAVGLDGKNQPHQSIEEMAQHYIGCMKGVQKEGPYYLMGYSFGGLVALEMLLQLTANNDQVAWLGLLDTAAPLENHIHKINWNDSQWILALSSVLEFELNKTILVDPSVLKTMSLNEAQEYFYQCLSNAYGISNNGTRTQLRALFEVFKANIEIRYRLKKEEKLSDLFSGPSAPKVVLFRAEEEIDTALFQWLKQIYQDQYDALIRDPSLGWTYYIKNLNIIKVPGNHYSIFSPVYISKLAQKIKEAL